MTTAREQAREATVAIPEPMNGDEVVLVRRAADAASDVWEPLLRDVVAELERTMSHLPHMHSAVLRRAKQTLGETE